MPHSVVGFEKGSSQLHGHLFIVVGGHDRVYVRFGFCLRKKPLHSATTTTAACSAASGRRTAARYECSLPLSQFSFLTPPDTYVWISFVGNKQFRGCTIANQPLFGNQ